MKAALLLALVTLTACAGLNQQRCMDYGFKPGTDKFAECVQLRTMRQQDAISAWGRQVQANEAAANQTNMTTTSCNRVGNSVVCNTF